jgi:hypothetical protein
MSSPIKAWVDEMDRVSREKHSLSLDSRLTQVQKDEKMRLLGASLPSQSPVLHGGGGYRTSIDPKFLVRDEGIIYDVLSKGVNPIRIRIGQGIEVHYESRSLPSYVDKVNISNYGPEFENLSVGMVYQFEGYVTSFLDSEGEKIFWISKYPTPKAGSTPSSGPCFIATAAFGSVNNFEVVSLRSFRDRFLVKSLAGRLFISTYYQVSPPIAWVIGRSQVLRKVTRAMLRFFVLPFTKNIQH